MTVDNEDRRTGADIARNNPQNSKAAGNIKKAASSNEQEKTLSTALPRYLAAGGGKAVLLVHGYTGITREMVYLGERLHQAGYTVSIPRLPGHGTNSNDFHQTKWQDWLRRATDAYLDLKCTHEQVYICGLSMGGVITILLAQRFKPAKIVLAAPAIFVTSKLLPLTEIVRFFINRVKNENADPPQSAEEKILFKEYWQWRSYSPLAQFNRLRRRSLKALPQITAETLTIVSKKDNTVPLQVADHIEAAISSKVKKTIVLEESGHVVVDDCQREFVADSIVEWFSQ